MCVWSYSETFLILEINEDDQILIISIFVEENNLVHIMIVEENNKYKLSASFFGVNEDGPWSIGGSNDCFDMSGITCRCD